ncbi:MAG: hypothetical protein OEV36_12365, partial [Myxococcales bacterium]|nr:hypothetical protein [Myxococcales bacterium]
MRGAGCVFVAALAALLPARAHAQTGETGETGEPSSEPRGLVLPVLAAEADGPGETVRIEQLHTFAEALRHELTVRGHEVWRADRASERFE